MKHLNFFIFLVSLAVISSLSSCSSTKYGAHFQASKYHPHVPEKAEKAVEKAPVPEEVPVQISDLVGEPAGAGEIESHASSPVASVKEVPVVKKFPKEEDLTARQEQAIREVKERLQNMSRQEKKEIRRQVRKLRISDYVKNLPASEKELNDLQQEGEVNLVALILAIFIPPLGVFIDQGVNNKFWISLVLTILGVTSFLFIPAIGLLPAVVYSVLVVLNFI